MTTNLIQLTRAELTPEIIHRASALVGESPDRTQQAMRAAIPMLVKALAETASSGPGAEQLRRVLDEAGPTGGTGGYLDRLKERNGGAQSVMQMGKELLGRVLGNRAGAVVEATAGTTAMSRSAAHGLLGMVTPLVLGVLGREVHARNLDTAGLASLLADEKRAAMESVPMPGGLGASPRAPDVREPGAKLPPPSSLSRIWPLLVLLPLIILAFLLFRRRDTTPPAAPRTTTESAPVVVEPPVRR